MRTRPAASRRTRRRRLAAGVLPAVALGVGLTSSPAAAHPVAAHPAAAHPAVARPADSAAGPAKAPKVRWDRFTAVDLGGGWRLVDLEGDAPVYGLELDGTVEGLVSFIAFPLDSLPGVPEALAAGGPRAALRVHVDNFLASFRDDRTQGCGPDYVFTPEPTRFLHAPGGHAVSYGFTGGAGGGVTERTVQWAQIRGDQLVLANVPAYDEGGCLPPEGLDLTTAQSAAVADRVGALIARNGFPRFDGAGGA